MKAILTFLIFVLLCLFGGSILSAQSVKGDTLSFDYVRTLQAVSEQQYYYVGAKADALLTRTGATVQITKIDVETGVFTVLYSEAFLVEDDAVAVFTTMRAQMLPKL